METLIDEKQVAVLKNQAKFENTVNMVQLMKTAGGRVMLVAFKRGEKLDTHTAPGDAMVNVVEGRVVFDIEGVDTPVNAGEFFTMKKGTVHAVTAPEDSKVMLTIFN